MITMKELLIHVQDNYELPPEHKNNLERLLSVMNELRAAYGQPMIITSGYRTLEHHLEIYKAKGITDKSHIPMASNHLKGLACDVEAPYNGTLKKFILDNLDLCEKLGLYFESLDVCPTWLHCQIVAPRSGKRFFNP